MSAAAETWEQNLRRNEKAHRYYCNRWWWITKAFCAKPACTVQSSVSVNFGLTGCFNYRRWTTLLIFTSDSIYAAAHVCHGNFICLPVARMICIKTAEHIIEILSLSDRAIILVVRHQGSLRNLTASPQWGHRIQGGSDFRRICGYILEIVIDRSILDPKAAVVSRRGTC